MIYFIVAVFVVLSILYFCVIIDRIRDKRYKDAFMWFILIILMIAIAYIWSFLFKVVDFYNF